MDWNNVDLTSEYERDQDILDGYSFDTLLLEISCNVKDITPQSVHEQFEISLKNKIDSAREVFSANFKNIVLQAKKERR